MATEIQFLHLLLVVAMWVAPRVTSRFFQNPSKLYDICHVIAFALTTSGLFLNQPMLTFSWLLFCVFGFALFLRRGFAHLSSASELAKAVPFVFSIIGATWLVSGSNGFGLLGYGKPFSYYASLHSHVLGWIVVGCIAFLANEATRFRRLHLTAVFVCLVSFLLVAFGINGIPVIKPIGVFGLTLMIFASQILFLVDVRKTNTAAFALGTVSFLALGFTMTLAWQNEFGALSIEHVFGARSMVSLHGVVNGVVVAPFFFLAVDRSRRADH